MHDEEHMRKGLINHKMGALHFKTFSKLKTLLQILPKQALNFLSG
jgi:hypothetical protein